MRTLEASSLDPTHYTDYNGIITHYAKHPNGDWYYYSEHNTHGKPCWFYSHDYNVKFGTYQPLKEIEF